MAYVLVLAVLAGAVYLISSPLRVVARPARSDHDAAEVAELDLRTGKLSDDDHAAIDGSLRAEAVDILHRLDRARETDGIPSGA